VVDVFISWRDETKNGDNPHPRRIWELTKKMALPA
jgi:hypothetical protein